MAAPLNNKFSYNGGRPPRYDNPEVMWEVMAEYFETTKTKTGIYKPTIEGLTFALGFANRKALHDYGNKDQVFGNVVSRAKTFIKSCYEANLYGFAWAGASFALRNIGKEDWQEETTQNIIEGNVKANFGGVVQAASEPTENT